MKIVRRGNTQFEFAPSGRQKLTSIHSIGVVRVSEGKESLVWWIVSDSYSQTWTPVSTSELRGTVAAKAREQYESAPQQERGRRLNRLTYGKVPRGFRQMAPETGDPPTLREGVEYILHITGSEFEAFRFTA